MMTTRPKLTLRVDDLAVESFSAGAAPRAAGTVHAHGGTNGAGCGSANCWSNDCPPTEAICVTADLACQTASPGSGCETFDEACNTGQLCG